MLNAESTSDLLQPFRLEVGPGMKTIFTDQDPHELVDKWFKLQQETFNKNKNHLTVLSYIV